MLKKYMWDETGATAMEYGLIAALIAVSLIAGATAIGTSLDGFFSGASDKMGDAKAP